MMFKEETQPKSESAQSRAQSRCMIAGGDINALYQMSSELSNTGTVLYTHRILSLQLPL